MLIKCRKTIKKWLNEGGEQQALEYEREQRVNWSFIKRNNHSDKNHEDNRSENSSSEEYNQDHDHRRGNRKVRSHI